MAGWPVRALLIGLIAVYRVTLSSMTGGQCRFYPSCSAYAEQAIRNTGALRGLALSAWRVLRCSPLSAGGVDHPPGPMYDNLTHADAGRPEVTA
jgi:putative membrane protein insertion efficiency factor